MPMRIDLDLRWGAAVSGIDRVAGKLDAVSKKLGTLQGQLNGIGANPGGGSGGGSGASGGAGRGGSFIQGRHQRLLKAQANLQKALQTRHIGIINDAQEALTKAQKAVAGQGFGQRLMQLIGTTRWTPGQGFAPLLNRIGSLFGGKGGGAAGGAAGAAAGAGIAVGVGLVIGALKLFEVALRTSTDAMRELTTGKMLTGGTDKQSAFLRSLGVDPGAAAGLRGRLASDPYAARTGRQLGMGVTLGRPFGKTNEAAILEQALIGLSKVADAEERLRKARSLGLDDYMMQIEVLRNHGAEVQQDTQRLEEAMKNAGPSFMEFDFQMGRLKRQFEITSINGVLPFIRVLSSLMESVAKSQKPMEDWGKSVGKKLGGVIDAVEPTGWFKALGRVLLGTGGEGASPIPANTNAIQENTALLKAGLYGGGSRFRGGMPASLKGDTFQRGVEMKAITMGAFSL